MSLRTLSVDELRKPPKEFWWRFAAVESIAQEHPGDFFSWSGVQRVVSDTAALCKKMRKIDKAAAHAFTANNYYVTNGWNYTFVVMFTPDGTIFANVRTFRNVSGCGLQRGYFDCKSGMFVDRGYMLCQGGVMPLKFSDGWVEHMLPAPLADPALQPVRTPVTFTNVRPAVDIRTGAPYDGWTPQEGGPKAAVLAAFIKRLREYEPGLVCEIVKMVGEPRRPGFAHDAFRCPTWTIQTDRAEAVTWTVRTRTFARTLPLQTHGGWSSKKVPVTDETAFFYQLRPPWNVLDVSSRALEALTAPAPAREDDNPRCNKRSRQE